jgi:hypothetical protein
MGATEGTIELPEEGEPGSNTPYVGPQSLDLSELEELGGAQNAAALLETQLDGDQVPEEFRGKKLTDVLGVIGNLKSALKTSEDARTQALATAEALARSRQEPVAAPAPAPAPEGPKERTAEEWKELYESDPFTYQQERFAAMERQLARSVQSQVAPATATAAATAKQAAMSAHKEAFELLGAEIDQFVNMAFPTPEAKATLAQPGAWDRVVHYVQGANIDKVIAAREAKRSSTVAADRQRAERDAAPPAFNSARTPAPRGGRLTPATMDETSKEIARNLMPDLPPQKAYEEYCKNYI